LKRIGRRFPKWLMHSFTNRFLDSDVWIHDQERAQRGERSGGMLTGKAASSSSSSSDSSSSGSGSDSVISRAGSRYVMPTQSDTGTRIWRQWWKRHMMDSPVFGEPQEPLKWLSHDEQVRVFVEWCLSVVSVWLFYCLLSRWCHYIERSTASLHCPICCSVTHALAPLSPLPHQPTHTPTQPYTPPHTYPHPSTPTHTTSSTDTKHTPGTAPHARVH
jgi:hypothetical protein